MKPSLRFASLLVARIKQSLHLLKAYFSRWVPRQSPALVPIPIAAPRLPYKPDRRHPDRSA